MAESSNTEAKWTLYTIIIAVIMVITGSINTLAAKWADDLVAEGRKFDHPFVQAVCMFIGEFLCLPAFLILFVYKRWRYRRNNALLIEDTGSISSDDDDGDDNQMPTIPRFNPFVFLPASLCDMCATSIMYVGLNLTFASSFQMLRGAVVVFTGLLSVAFLRSKLQGYKWLGMFGVVAGLVIVGLSDIIFGNNDRKDTNNIISGDLLIVMAQVIVAIQMVYEQRFVLKYDVHPLLAVGLEGLFGMVILSVLIIPMNFIHVPSTFSANPEHKMEDALDAFKQMTNNPLILLALAGTISSIAFFNFAGISVTKELSATTRMVLDSIRTILIWAFSLAVGWQEFVALQILGFALLIWGMFVYNDLIFGPFFRNRLLPWFYEKGIRCGFCLNCCGVPLEEQQPLGRSVHEEDEERNDIAIA